MKPAPLLVAKKYKDSGRLALKPFGMLLETQESKGRQFRLKVCRFQELKRKKRGDNK